MSTLETSRHGSGGNDMLLDKLDLKTVGDRNQPALQEGSQATYKE